MAKRAKKTQEQKEQEADARMEARKAIPMAQKREELKELSHRPPVAHPTAASNQRLLEKLTYFLRKLPENAGLSLMQTHAKYLTKHAPVRLELADFKTFAYYLAQSGLYPWTRATGYASDNGATKEVLDYIATDLRNELDLVDRMRPKPTATIEDFGTILGAIWSEPAQFRFPRLRLQHHVVHLLVTYTASRIGEIVLSTAYIDKPAAWDAVRYKDLSFELVGRGPLQPVDVQVVVTVRNLKGARNDPNKWKETLLRIDPVPLLCPVRALFALATDDKVFETPMSFDKALELRLEENQRIKLRMVPDKIEEFVFRRVDITTGTPTSRPLDGHDFTNDFRRVLLSLGIVDPNVSSYIWHRLTGNALNVSAVSEGQRMQAMSHSIASCFAKHYEYRRTMVDTQALLHGREDDRDAIKASMGLSRLSSGPVGKASLSFQRRQEVLSSPAIADLMEKRNQLKDRILSRFPTLIAARSADDDAVRQYDQVSADLGNRTQALITKAYKEELLQRYEQQQGDALKASIAQAAEQANSLDTPLASRLAPATENSSKIDAERDLDDEPGTENSSKIDAERDLDDEPCMEGIVLRAAVGAEDMDIGDAVEWMKRFKGEPASLDEAYEEVKAEGRGDAEWGEEEVEEYEIEREEDEVAEEQGTSGDVMKKPLDPGAIAPPLAGSPPSLSASTDVRTPVASTSKHPPSNTPGLTASRPSTSAPTDAATTSLAPSPVDASKAPPPPAKLKPPTPTETFLLRLQTRRTEEEVKDFPESKLVDGLLSSTDFYGDRSFYVGERLNEDGTCPLCDKKPKTQYRISHAHSCARAAAEERLPDILSSQAPIGSCPFVDAGQPCPLPPFKKPDCANFVELATHSAWHLVDAASIITDEATGDSTLEMPPDCLIPGCDFDRLYTRKDHERHLSSHHHIESDPNATPAKLNLKNFLHFCFRCQTWLFGVGAWEDHCEEHLGAVLEDLAADNTASTVDSVAFKVRRPGTCIFCVTNDSLTPSERIFQYDTPTALDMHISQHVAALARLAQVNQLNNTQLSCPSPACTSLHPFAALFDLATHLTSTHELALVGRSSVVAGKTLRFPATLPALPLWSGDYEELTFVTTAKRTKAATKARKKNKKEEGGVQNDGSLPVIDEAGEGEDMKMGEAAEDDGAETSSDEQNPQRVVRKRPMPSRYKATGGKRARLFGPSSSTSEDPDPSQFKSAEFITDSDDEDDPAPPPSQSIDEQDLPGDYPDYDRFSDLNASSTGSSSAYRSPSVFPGSDYTSATSPSLGFTPHLQQSDDQGGSSHLPRFGDGSSFARPPATADEDLVEDSEGEWNWEE